MNVIGLIKAVLRNMNEKDDTQTIFELGGEILSYLNEGYVNAVVTKLKPVKTVTCESVDSRIALKDIGSDFYEINRVIDKYGIEMRYSRNSEYLFIKDGIYDVEYIFVPKELKNETDEPVISSAFHYILSDYATYRMFLKGSKARQARGEAFLSSYLNGLNRLMEAKRMIIKNKFGSDING